MKKKQLIYLIIILVLSALLIASGSYAYWKWFSNTNKNVVFNTSKGLEEYIIYDEGESKFVGDFKVTDTFLEGVHTTISIHKTSEASNVSLYAKINMDINAIGTNIRNNPSLKWVVTEGNSEVTNPTILSRGNFLGVNANDTLELYNNIEVLTQQKEFTIWLWLDSSVNFSEELTGETIDTSIWTQIDQVVEDRFEITKLSTFGNMISATAVNSTANITHYQITTSNTQPTSWVSIPSTDIGNIYTLEYNTQNSGLHYIWFKDNDNKVISNSIQVNLVYMITYMDVGNASFSGTHGNNYPEEYTTGVVTNLDTPTKTGYTFIGYYSNSNGTGTPITKISANQTGNITLYAKWQANALTFNDQSFTKTYSTSSQTLTITGASNGTGSYTYTEKSEKNANNESTNYISINGTTITIAANALPGTYTYVVTVRDNNSNVTKDATMTITINAISATIPTNSLCVAKTYNGSQQQITSATSGTGYTLSGYSQTNAGSHTITATLTSGYRWSDNTTGTKTFNCSISKADAVCPTTTAYSGIYDATAHTISVSGGSGGTIQYRNSTTGTWGTTNLSRTDVGVSTTYVQVAGDSNHNTKDCGNKTITINNATITFNANTGTLSGTGTLYTRKNATAVYTGIQNSTVGTIPTASKTGYTFNGWYTATSDGSKVLNANGTFTGTAVSGYTTTNAWAVTSNKTLYAQFSVNTPTAPTITASDSITSNNWHKANFTLNFSGSTVTNGTVTYYYGTSSSSMTNTGTSVSISSETTGTTYYVKACNANSTSTCSATVNYIVKLDKTVPTSTISSTSTQKATSQTATLSCTDAVGVVSYYYGTSAPTSSSTYTTVTSTTNFSTTKTVSSAGTYYLACKDAAGNVSTTASKAYHKYTVKNMLQNTTGSTYTTTDYTQASSYDYIAPSGTSLAIDNIYTIPTGSHAGRISYYSIGEPGATGATTIAKATNPTLSANNTIYAMWFNRNIIYIKYKPNGGTVTPTTTNGSTTYTWALDSNGYITRSTNGGTATNNFASYRYNSNSLTIDLHDHNYSQGLHITRNGYVGKTGEQWICESGCTTPNRTFSQASGTALSSTNEMCDASTANCTIVLKVNWVPSPSSFNYTGGQQTYTVPENGIYKLEVWGASSGYSSSANVIGYGAYATGIINLTLGQTLYINVGQEGTYSTGKTFTVPGTYNGGGSGAGYNASMGRSSGGGATHIATSSGLLASLATKINNILIVAGGGGGGSYYSASENGKGGDAGGIVGSPGTISAGDGYGTIGTGGSQSSGGTGGNTGSFGQGADYKADTSRWHGSGGGGGFYGGGSGVNNAGGGGGSSYIGNSSLTNKHMHCYNCTTSNETNTKTNTGTCVNATATADCAKSGDGYAKITYVGALLSTPTITASDNITSNNWHTANFTLSFSGNSNVVYYYGTNSNSLTTSGQSVSISTDTGGTTYYVKACNTSDTNICSQVASYVVKLSKVPIVTLTTDASYSNSSVTATLTAVSGHGIKLPYYYKISTSSTCNSTTTGFTSSNNLNYTFTNLNVSESYYVCTKVVDNANNAKYVSKSVAFFPSNPSYNDMLTNVQCNTSSVNKAINYTGSCLLVNDGESNWKIKFTSSGILTNNFALNVDLFIVGGANNSAGGYAATYSNINLLAENTYNVTIASGITTGNSQAGQSSVSRNNTILYFANGASGISGGSGKGRDGFESCPDFDCWWPATNPASRGGSYGGNGGGSESYGRGQLSMSFNANTAPWGGQTTCEFNEGASNGCTNGDNYAYSRGCGGYGINGSANGSPGNGLTGENTGACPGGSGIVIIRNAR